METEKNVKCNIIFQDDIWSEIHEKSLIRSPPLLALLPCSIHDIPLAHNLTILIKKIIDKVKLIPSRDVFI